MRDKELLKRSIVVIDDEREMILRAPARSAVLGHSVCSGADQMEHEVVPA